MTSGTLRSAINQAFLTDETALVQDLLTQLSNYNAVDVDADAHELVTAVRNKQYRQSVTDAFLHEYRLNSDEGIVLMGIAEALLRIPDRATQDRFLADKLTAAHWHQHLHHSDSLLVNLSTVALQLTGQFEQHLKPAHRQQQLFEKLLARLGQPLIRKALNQAMQLLGSQFVIAGTIEEAIAKSRRSPLYRYSFDMLGEAAVTAADADRFYQAYLHAIAQLATLVQGRAGDVFEGPSISIKLSALCPRYESLQHRRAVPELQAKLLYLVKRARAGGVSVTVDAEESDRLEMSLDIFEAVFADPELDAWQGFGLAVQAYQKRALPVIQWLADLARTQRRKIPVRLVKGAYWDTEIKRTQENGLHDYPVFTRKSATDVAYLVCAQTLLNEPAFFYPQFATHNAHAVTAIHHLAQRHPGYEFQRLHGMGELLYRETVEHRKWGIPCRIYAPVGNYQDLLPYLVRRLLENGANTSFINQVENPDIAVKEVIRDPVACWREIQEPRLPSPSQLYGSRRLNSQGLNLADPTQLNQLHRQLDGLSGITHQAGPLIDGKTYSAPEHFVCSPYDMLETVGTVAFSDDKAVADALDSAAKAFSDWRLVPAHTRAACLNKTADLIEENRLELVSLCIREGGRTIKDALAEVREAVDFCRYYAACAVELFDRPSKLPGPTGEENLLRYYGRGIFICISPWNFPIAIFTGQIAAALAAGNTVIAKPAELTSLAAMACIQIMHRAGVPESVLHFLPGQGSQIGPKLLADDRVAGVAFTGSIATAQVINRQLAEHRSIVPLIAETGGQNVMIADTTAHKEQLVLDAIQSAFNSAGQRCSALRVLFLPHETADKVIELLIGAMHQLTLGNPGDYATDIGPVISPIASQTLSRHLEAMRAKARILYQMTCSKSLRGGSFFPPCLIELQKLSQLKGEVFGPILHVIRYRSDDLDRVIDSVNASGYGLTLGIHSRINDTICKIQQNVKVGNIYINRNMIGAVVGVQPFGGMGLSGTGPKAGGPDYLRRFAVEQTVTTNTAAVGGNTGLLAQDLR